MSSALRKIINLTIILAMSTLLSGLFLSPHRALADPQPLQQAENSASSSSSTNPNDDPNCQNTSTPDKLANCVQHDQIVVDLNHIVDALSIGVAIVVVIMIMAGGIQYMAAGDSADATAKAKKRITDALLALVAFIFLDAFIQWLIPGGIFK